MDLEKLFAPTILNEELQRYVTPLGSGLHALQHPLVYSAPYFEAENGFLNAKFLEVSKRVRQSVLDNDFFTYIGLHQRPYQLQALLEVADHMSDGDFWTAVKDVWIDSENIWQNTDEWRKLWNSGRDERNEFVMSPEENAALAGLPQRFPVYRGFSHSDSRLGMSWTLDLDKATWFARRYSGPGCSPAVVTVTLFKKDVLAYFIERGELEIVFDPLRSRKKIVDVPI